MPCRLRWRVGWWACQRRLLDLERSAGQQRTRRVSLEEIERIKAHCRPTTNRPGTIDLAAIIDILSVLPIRIGELARSSGRTSTMRHAS